MPSDFSAIKIRNGHRLLGIILDDQEFGPRPVFHFEHLRDKQLMLRLYADDAAALRHPAAKLNCSPTVRLEFAEIQQDTDRCIGKAFPMLTGLVIRHAEAYQRGCRLILLSDPQVPWVSEWKEE